MHWLAVFNLMIVSFTPVHVFPDGYIDRAMSVVIRDDEVCIEYSAAMNDNTIRELLDDWQQKPESPAGPPIREDDSQTAFNPKPAPSDVPTGSEEKTTPDSSEANQEDFKNDAELLQLLQDRAVAEIAKNLAISYQGKPLNLERPTEVPPARYHMSVTLQYKLKLPEPGPGEKQPQALSIVDRNFDRFDGAVRYSLKAGGNCLLTNSNVAPILVRSERIELAGLNEENREQAKTIQAKILQLNRTDQSK